jgi:hypothetical protein
MARLQLRSLVQQAANQGRKAPVRVTVELVEDIYDALNRSIFDNVLTRPKITVRSYKKRGIWGECEGYLKGSRWGKNYTKVIRIEREFPNLKKLISVVAHEMVHQYEWDVLGVMTHGNSFFAWEETLRSNGIRLCIVV